MKHYFHQVSFTIVPHILVISSIFKTSQIKYIVLVMLAKMFPSLKQYVKGFNLNFVDEKEIYSLNLNTLILQSLGFSLLCKYVHLRSLLFVLAQIIEQK